MFGNSELKSLYDKIEKQYKMISDLEKENELLKHKAKYKLFKLRRYFDNELIMAESIFGYISKKKIHELLYDEVTDEHIERLCNY